MSRKKPPRKGGRPRGRKSKQSPGGPIHVETVNLRAIALGTRLGSDALTYHWLLYAILAHQRTAAASEIRKALLGAADGPFLFSKWRRIVDYEYCLHPLSTVGSVLGEVGGRFNIGRIDESKFPTFPALYLASTNETAMIEKFGQSDDSEGLSDLDFALRSADSFTSVAVSGTLETVIDLRRPERLQPLLDIFGSFYLTEELYRRAKKLRLTRPVVVKTMEHLMTTLMAKNWRQEPILWDVPSGAQIFGQLVRAAGIEGIIWPSVRGDDKCLAVFPENVSGKSYVQLDDEPPSPDVPHRLDEHTWKTFVSQ